MMLVDLDQAKDHLRVTHSSDDEDIVAKIKAASAIIVAHIKEASTDFLDTNGDVDPSLVPDKVHIATLLLLDTLYRERGSGDEWIERGYLPRAVDAILCSMRTPTVA